MNVIKKFAQHQKKLARNNPKQYWFKADYSWPGYGWAPVKREAWMMVGFLLIIWVSYEKGLIEKYNLEIASFIIFLILVYIISKKSEPMRYKGFWEYLPSLLRKDKK